MTDKEINGYSLSKKWWDFANDNPEKITPTHCAIFFFIIHHANKLGWKKTFGLPSYYVTESIGIKRVQTYKKYLMDLVDWEMIYMVQQSKNQYTANIISLHALTDALTENVEASVEASVKAPVKASVEALLPYINKENLINLKTDKPENDKTFLEQKKSSPDNQDSNSGTLTSLEQLLLKEKNIPAAPHNVHSYLTNTAENQLFIDYLSVVNVSKFPQIRELVRQVIEIDGHEERIKALGVAIGAGYKRIIRQSPIKTDTNNNSYSSSGIISEEQMRNNDYSEGL